MKNVFTYLVVIYSLRSYYCYCLKAAYLYNDKRQEEETMSCLKCVTGLGVIIQERGKSEMKVVIFLRHE